MEGGAAGGAAGEGAGRPGLTLLLLTLQLQFLLQLLLQFLLPHLFRPGLVVKMFIKFYKYIFSIRKVIEINILVVFRVNLVGRLCVAPAERRRLFKASSSPLVLAGGVAASGQPWRRACAVRAAPRAGTLLRRRFKVAQG